MIRQINKEEVLPYKIEAEKASLIFCESATLYGLFVNEELAAFSGIIFYKNKAVLKNFYVPINFRGKGYFKKLFHFCVEKVKLIGLSKIEATCTDMSINYFIANNFKVIKEYKKFKKVINENIQQY
jgi:predicted GNAT family acetyltransferase